MITFTCECAEKCGLTLDVGSGEYKRGNDPVIPLRILHTLGKEPTIWLNREALLALSDALRERGERLPQMT